MKSRNTLVGVFIQCWLIPKLKCICKPIVTNITHLKPTPLYIVCYPELVSVIFF